MPIKAAIELARPSHWIKNVIVLFPVIFALRYDEPAAWGEALIIAAAFCLASSGVYALNDIRDRRSDREHPVKRRRPVASGRIGVVLAAVEGVVLLAASLGVAAVSTPAALAILAAYIVLQIAYTWVLKAHVLVDVIGIALGFVLRAAGGAVAIGVAVSPWLFVVTFTLCLFMGFCKRTNELATMGGAERAPAAHRGALASYSRDLLVHLMTLTASVAVVGFLMYAASGRTVGHLGTNYLIYTLPLVVYGVFRFAMLSMRGRYTDPTDLVLRDRPFQATVLLWLVAVGAIIVYGERIGEWLGRLI